MSEGISPQSFEQGRFGPQKSRIVPEDSIANEVEHIHSREHDAPWVGMLDQLRLLREQNAPDFILQPHEKYIDGGQILVDMRRAFSNKLAKDDFNTYITLYLHGAGKLEEMMARFGEDLKLADPETRLLKSLGILSDEELVSGDIAYDFAGLVTSQDSSVDMAVELAEIHASALEDSRKKIEAMSESMRIEFHESVAAAVSAGLLPQSAILQPDSPRQRRADKLEVIMIDPVVCALLDRVAYYTAGDNTISMGAHLLNNEGVLKRGYSHEMFHMLSGLTLRRFIDDSFFEDEYEFDEDDQFEDEDLSDFVDVDVIDANYYTRDTSVARVGLRSKRLVFNEAYTEWAALTVVGGGYDSHELWRDYIDGGYQDMEGLKKKYESVYLPQRVMLAGLVAHGIDLMVVGEAYFESYEPKIVNPDREPGNAMPHRVALDNEIARLFANTTMPFKSLRQLETGLREMVKQEEGYPWGESTQKDMQHAWVEAKILARLLGDLES